jgi:hypothetical protein
VVLKNSIFWDVTSFRALLAASFMLFSDSSETSVDFQAYYTALYPTGQNFALWSSMQKMKRVLLTNFMELSPFSRTRQLHSYSSTSQHFM